MQNTMRKILSFALVCVMLLGMIPMAAMPAAAQTQLTEVSAWNLVLADEIAVNFCVSISDAAAEDAVMVVTDGYGVTEYPIAEAEKTEDGLYQFTAHLAAAQLADEITLQLISGEEAGEVHSYSAVQYAHAILEGDYSQSAKELVLSMLGYGAAAQVYFSYNTENLANAGYEAAAAQLPAPEVVSPVSGSVSGVSYYAASLLNQSRVAIRFYFQVSGDVSGYTFTTESGKVLIPVAKGAHYYVDVPGINPQDYHKTVKVLVSDGADTLTVSYSPMTYILRQYANTAKEELRNMVAAMYQYHNAAKAYLSANGNVSTDGNGIVTEQVILQGNQSSAIVAAGTQLEDDVTELTLSATPMAETGSDVEVADNEKLISMDVHVEGIAASNTVPVLVTLDQLAPEALNKGNITLYHVENGETVAMTRVYSASELDAHNEYYYDIATGTVTVALASFSEIAVVANEENPWDGDKDTAWYSDEADEFKLYNAQQLAGLGQLVDGGKTFEGKTITLGFDINLYGVDANGERISFDPIGYGYESDGGQVFKGTLDGNGHTIRNLYQNGWALGLSYSTAGGGLFASVVDADFMNLTLDGAEVVMECIDMGTLVGYAYGTCSFTNIIVSNSVVANYNRYTGGVVGEVNGTHTFYNVDVADSTTLSALWGTFDPSVGGIIGGKYGEATVHMEKCDVACELDVFNDVTSAYQWYSYRRCGMLIGLTEQTRTDEGRTTAKADFLTTVDCTVVYGDWARYHYCEFTNAENTGNRYPWVRVEEGLHNDAFSNPRYGHPKDINGVEVTTLEHEHAAGDTHNMEATFHQLYGGGQGCYGGNWHIGNGVTEYVTYGDGIRPPEHVEKFTAKVSAGHEIVTGTKVTLGELFEDANAATAIQPMDVHAFVSPVTQDGTVSATFNKVNDDWTKSSLTFSGRGTAEITITDYYYCVETRLTVTVTGNSVILHDAQSHSAYVYGNDGITLPEATPVENKVFVGWVADIVAEGTPDQPDTFAAGSIYKEAGDHHLYALYAYTDTVPGEESWKMVTDASNLAAGDEIVIVAKDSNYALSTAQNNNNRGQAAVTKSDDTIAAPGADVQIITLAAGNQSGTLAFNVGNGYLFAASSGSNYLRTETTLSDNSSWAITIAADGTATIVAQGTNTRNTMQYNSSSSIFACYSTASQKAICIYKKTVTAAEETTLYGTQIADCAHDRTELQNASAATCTATGYTGDKVCIFCGAKVQTGSVIPVLDHNYVDGTCSVCGKTQPQNAQVTTPEQVTAGKYVIVAEYNGVYYAMGTAVDGKIAAVEVTVENGSVDSEDAPVWTINPYESGISLNNGTAYLKYGTSGTDFSTNAAAYEWTLTQGENGAMQIGASTDTGRGILYRKSTNKFGAYAISNGTNADYQINLYLFKMTDAESCQHTETTTTTVDATCTEGGSTTVTCDACGYVVSKVTTEALGHSYVDGVCSVCGSKDVVIPEIPESGVYTLVTDISEITAGGKFVIVAEVGSVSYAMSHDNTTKKNSITPTEVTVSDNTVTTADAPAWIIAQYGQNELALTTGSTYLKQSSADGAELTTVSTPFAWTVKAAEAENCFHIVSSAANTRGIVYRTGDFNYFRAYTLDNTDGDQYYPNLKLYKLVEAAVEVCTHENTTVTSTATCTEAGIATETCDDCHQVVSITDAEATGHNFVDGICANGCGTEEPATKHYKKITQAPTDWTAGTYLIVYEAGNVAFDGSLTTLDAASNYLDVTITDDGIEATDAMKEIAFTINAEGHIKSASGYYIGQTTDANGLKSNTSTTYVNTITVNNDGTVNLVSGGAYLRFNSAQDQMRFRYYRSSSYTSQKAICLYMLVEE